MLQRTDGAPTWRDADLCEVEADPDRREGPETGAEQAANPRQQQNLVAFVAPRTQAPSLAELPIERIRAGLTVAIHLCDSTAELDAVVANPRLRLLVLHSALVAQVGLPGLSRLRARRPDVHWVVASQGRLPNLPDIVIRTRARGCIDLDRSSRIAEALDRVVAGDLWLPRWLLHQVYANFLDLRRAPAAVAPEPAAASGPALTRREASALELMRQGFTNRAIGERLDISVSTVKKHLKNAFDKLGLHSRRQALG